MSSPSDGLNEEKKGLIYALTCYLIWGGFPLYWYPLTHSAITADQLLAQRIVWSAVFSVVVLILFRQTGVLISAVKNRKLLILFVCSAFSISINWLVYLWAISKNHVLDASLGYFLSPLFNILLGRLFFNERTNRIQSLAIALAAIGVLWLAILGGQIPWVALLLTISFGSYSLLRKTAPLPALPGMALETLIMFPFAAAYLWWTARHGHLVFSELSTLQLAVLFGSGAVTTIPLLLFASGARRISMTNLGILQYVSPTCQFMLGLFLFHEAFNFSRFIGYLWVWAGVGLYMMSMLWAKKTHKTA